MKTSVILRQVGVPVSGCQSIGTWLLRCSGWLLVCCYEVANLYRCGIRVLTSVISIEILAIGNFDGGGNFPMQISLWTVIDCRTTQWRQGFNVIGYQGTQDPCYPRSTLSPMIEPQTLVSHNNKTISGVQITTVLVLVQCRGSGFHALLSHVFL